MKILHSCREYACRTVILFIVLLFSTLALATTSRLRTNRDGFLVLLGKFNNGARFVYQTGPNGKRKLIFDHDDFDFEQFLEFDFKYLPVFGKASHYRPLEGDRAVYFGDDTALYALIENGVFTKIADHTPPKNGMAQNETDPFWTIRSDIYDEETKIPYAILSRAQPPVTFLMRLTDGSIIKVDYRFREDLSSARIIGNQIRIDPVIISDGKKSFPKVYGIAKFATSPLKLQLSSQAPPFSMPGNEPPKTIDKPAKSADIEPSVIFAGQPAGDLRYKISNNQFHFKTIAGIDVVLPVTLKEIKFDTSSGAPLWSTTTFQHKGVKYELVSFVFAGSIPVETFIVREDGKFTIVDFLEHNFTDLDVSKWINDGILRIPSSPREIDLDHFEAEARFLSKRRKALFNKDGTAVDVISTVAEFFEDVSLEAKSDPEFARPDLDERTLENIRVAHQIPGQGSVVILGDAGVGKTELAKGFIFRMLRGDYPELARTTRIFKVDAMTLGANATYAGIFEARLKSLVEYCKSMPCVIFMDDIHALRGEGTYEGQPNDTFQKIASTLSEGNFSILATSRAPEYERAFSGHTTLWQIITRVTMPAPTGQALLKAVRGWLGKHKMPNLSDDVIFYAEKLSTRFNATGAQPRNVSTLLGATFSNLVVKEGRARELTRLDVEKAAQKLFEIDEAFFDPEKLQAKLAALPKALDENIVGNSRLKKDVIKLGRQSILGTKDKGKPGMRLLIPGSPGTGKTMIAETYAKAMGKPYKVIELNGYANKDPQDLLREIATQLRLNCTSVIILDELDKAGDGAKLALLGLLQNGRFRVEEKLDTTSKSGHMVDVDATNADIIATTNAGQDFILESLARAANPLGFHSKKSEGAEDENETQIDERGLRKALERDGMSDALCSRFKVVPAIPSTKSQFRKIVELHIRLVIEDLRREQEASEISFADNDRIVFIDAMTEHYFAAPMDNRAALAISDHVRNAVSLFIAQHGKIAGKKVQLRFDADEFQRSTDCEQALVAG